MEKLFTHVVRIGKDPKMHWLIRFDKSGTLLLRRVAPGINSMAYTRFGSWSFETFDENPRQRVYRYYRDDRCMSDFSMHLLARDIWKEYIRICCNV